MREEDPMTSHKSLIVTTRRLRKRFSIFLGDVIFGILHLLHLRSYYPNGCDGGGIYNVCTLDLKTSTFSENSTGDGWSSWDDAYGSHSGTDGGAGGGIYNAGTLALTNSTINDNITGDCGWGNPSDWCS
jgi:hypothetical protein